MAEFDAVQETKAISSMLDISGEKSYQTGQILSNRFLDDAHKEFCKLNPEEKAATIDAMKNFDDSTNYFRIIKDGHGDPIGTTHSKKNQGDKTYMSFDCPYSDKK